MIFNSEYLSIIFLAIFINNKSILMAIGLSINHSLRYLLMIFILLLIPLIFPPLYSRGTVNKRLPICYNNSNENYIAGLGSLK